MGCCHRGERLIHRGMSEEVMMKIASYWNLKNWTWHSLGAAAAAAAADAAAGGGQDGDLNAVLSTAMGRI